MRQLIKLQRQQIGPAILLGSLGLYQVICCAMPVVSSLQKWDMWLSGKQWILLSVVSAIVGAAAWFLALCGCAQAMFNTKKKVYLLLLLVMLLPTTLQLGKYAIHHIQMTMSVPEPNFLRYPLGGKEASFSNRSRVWEPDNMVTTILPALPLLFLGIVVLLRRRERMSPFPFFCRATKTADECEVSDDMQ